MKILIIFAHPNQKSFCGALKDSFIDGVKSNNHSVDVIDLYKDKFNPVSFGDNEISPEVKNYQQLIKNSNYLVFIYPIWWFRAPAILEGWFDRVFTVGFAFDFKKVMPCDKAIIVNTYGSPALATKYFYMNIPFRRLKRGVLKMCGIKNIKRFNCWSVPFVSDRKRKDYLNKLFRLGSRLR